MGPKARIAAIEYYLPEGVLSNEEIAREHPGWTADDITAKTGIRERRIAHDHECASDLAVRAAEKLFSSGRCRPRDIDYILLCTQSPDYFLPTTACLIQHRLGVPEAAGALDFNLGCSGFVYGLGLAKGLIETGQSNRLLLICAETYSKYIDPGDRATRTIFGDAASATLIESTASDTAFIGIPVYGTDGDGARKLIVEGGAMRSPSTARKLLMNGTDIFTFTIRRIPALVQETLQRSGLEPEQIDFFVFHQANLYMMEHLRKKLRVPGEKFVVFLERCGNTVSSTIPIALKETLDTGRLKPGSLVMIVGFGVGYSWAASILRW